MLFECWPNVVDVGPTFKQYWVNVSFFLGTMIRYITYDSALIFCATLADVPCVGPHALVHLDPALSLDYYSASRNSGLVAEMDT